MLLEWLVVGEEEVAEECLAAEEGASSSKKSDRVAFKHKLFFSSR